MTGATRTASGDEATAPVPTVRVLGIDFFNGTLEQALTLTHAGGLVVAPSGPGLAGLGTNPHYDAALAAAELALVDSSYLARLWRRRSGETLNRISGLAFIDALLDDPALRAGPPPFWVLPSDADVEAARRHLAGRGIAPGPDDTYRAPEYTTGEISDPDLLERIRRRRPRHIILGIAGGKQEVLGHWLASRLDHRPAVICIGAAIAFLSGRQATIPGWADRAGLGWLLRVASDPSTYGPRYWKARKLRHLVRRFGREAPPGGQ